MPLILPEAELMGRLMVLLEKVLKSAPLITCKPQPLEAVAGKVITKLFSFTYFAPFRIMMPGLPTGVTETVLPEPSKVTVLVALAYGIFRISTCSLYGPVPAVTVMVTAPETPQVFRRWATSAKV